MTSSHPLPALCPWFARLASALDRRSAPRLALLFLGALLARGRRTVTSWIRAAGLSDQFRPCYTAVAAAGKKAEAIAASLVLTVVKPLLGGVERLTLAIDDTPTPRYGPHVEGAGIHHNPTPGPAGSPHVYGHVFVVLGLLLTHQAWGTIALPLLSRLYVRKKDLPKIDPTHRPEFRTKLELAVELLRWAQLWLGLLGKALWVVADGAYAKKEFLKPAIALGMTVVSRLRCDAALWSLPPVVPEDQRGPGRPRIYGPERISLAKRAGQRRGWTTEAFTLYGERVDQAVQDVPGDLEAGRRGDPGGAGGRADGVAGVLLHRPVGVGRRHPDGGGGPVRAGDHLPRLQGGRGGGPAAGAVPLGEHRGVPRVPVDIQPDRGVGLGPCGGRVGGPLGLAVGHAVTPAEPRRQAAGVAACAAGRGDSSGSTSRGHRGGNSGHGGTAAEPGCMNVY